MYYCLNRLHFHSSFGNQFECNGDCDCHYYCSPLAASMQSALPHANYRARSECRLELVTVLISHSNQSISRIGSRLMQLTTLYAADKILLTTNECW